MYKNKNYTPKYVSHGKLFPSTFLNYLEEQWSPILLLLAQFSLSFLLLLFDCCSCTLTLHRRLAFSSSLCKQPSQMEPVMQEAAESSQSMYPSPTPRSPWDLLIEMMCSCSTASPVLAFAVLRWHYIEFWSSKCFYPASSHRQATKRSLLFNTSASASENSDVYQLLGTTNFAVSQFNLAHWKRTFWHLSIILSLTGKATDWD